MRHDKWAMAAQQILYMLVLYRVFITNLKRYLGELMMMICLLEPIKYAK